MTPTSLSLIPPLVSFALEWAALALLVAGAIYWERAALSGIGIEGSLLSATLGMALAYEATGDFGVACAAGAGGAALFGLLGSGLVLTLKSDPWIGTFVLTLVPASALGVLVRSAPLRILRETPAPGLLPGTIFEGTYAEDLVANPWLWAALILLAVLGVVMLKTPYGLKLRGYSETPAYARRGLAQVLWLRITAAVLGALAAAPAAALLLRARPSSVPVGLGFIALACAAAGRWGFLMGILLAAGPALARALRPYAGASGSLGLLLGAVPFVLSLLYLVLLTRRALRAAATPQSRLDPDVL